MLESKNCKSKISSFPMAMSGGTGSILNDTTVIVCGGIMFNELHNYKCYYSFQTNFTSMNFSLNKYTSLASSYAVHLYVITCVKDMVNVPDKVFMRCSIFIL